MPKQFTRDTRVMDVKSALFVELDTSVQKETIMTFVKNAKPKWQRNFLILCGKLESPNTWP